MKTKGTTLFFYGNHNYNMPQHLLKEEFIDLKNLLKKIYLLLTKKKKREKNCFWLIKTRIGIAPELLLQTKKNKGKKLTFLDN